MPTKNRKPNNNGIHSYLQMKQFRSECTFRFDCEGNCYWIVNGRHLMEDEFNSLFPAELTRINVKGKTIGHAQQIV